MSWKIRQAVLSDIGFLVDIDPIAKTDSGRREQIERDVGSLGCWVACAANDLGVPIGYGCLDRSFFGEWFISLVVVSSTFRRSGVGRQIVTYLERCSTAQKIFTSTNTSNAPMRQLLRQLGYQDSGRIENLDAGDPELIFVKFLE
ncbi:GNAT family N-acetyltransferase [Pseudomonas purpurea]|uniref:GNAT family N-acetyltransferase n=1 Tax=Pseudomonas purpurea TaxID=3136737 RepID=UPI00326606D9